MPDPDSIVQPIIRAQRWQTIAMVILALALVGVVIWFAIRASDATEALCALRGDQERRLEASLEFLADNPDESQALRDAIRRGVEGQKSTIDALSSLSC